MQKKTGYLSIFADVVFKPDGFSGFSTGGHVPAPAGNILFWEMAPL
ncbi:MAG: hypothetical protein JW795_13235 [Chitinivibrionales bacterium]|nr:hypothetical protein [Chitinivibrionales bacterium]